MTPCGLAQAYDALAGAVPTGDDDEIAFSSETLPVAPADMATARLVVRKSAHWYHAYADARVDFLIFEAHRATYRHLALALLAKVFHPAAPEVRLRLAHPASDIREIVLDYDDARDGLTSVAGYKTRPERFTYRPGPIARYPLVDAGYPAAALPCFNLTSRDGLPGSDADWLGRDLVRCAGSDAGHVQLAQLLLDLARAEEGRDEITLESAELGNGGIAPGSAEARFVLPGNIAWSGAL